MAAAESIEINLIKTDVAVIKRDITQISQVYKKVDDTLDQMASIAKTIAVQEKILENDARRIMTLEENILKMNEKIDELLIKLNTDRELRHKEVIAAIEAMSKDLNTKLNDQSKRVTALENWRWYIAGITAVVMFVASKIPWATFFG